MPNLIALHKFAGVVATKRYPTIQREIKSGETEIIYARTLSNV